MLNWPTLFFTFLVLPGFAQDKVSPSKPQSEHQIPVNPNALDDQGKKIGKWTILFDSTKVRIDNPDNTFFYRLVTYHEGNPVGKVEDYYRNGSIQMKSTLISENPDQFDGKAIWYSEERNIINFKFYNEGRLDNENTILEFNKILEDHDANLQNHRDQTEFLHNLSEFYFEIGKYEESKPFFERVLELRKEQLGEEHVSYAKSLDDMGNVNYYLGNLEDAEKFYVDAQSILGKQLGENHLDYGNTISNLSNLYSRMGRYAEAEPLALLVIAIIKSELGENDVAYARALSTLGSLYYSMGRYEETEPLYLKSLEITKNALGEDHPAFAYRVNNLAALYARIGKHKEAVPLYKRAIELVKMHFGEDHMNYASTLSSLASSYRDLGRFKEAIPLYVKAKDIQKNKLGENHPNIAFTLSSMAILYQKMGRNEQAESMFSQANEIRRLSYGESHPSYGISLRNLAALYIDQGKLDKAKPMIITAIEIHKSKLGEDHPTYALSLASLARVNRLDGNYKEADSLYLVSLNIFKNKYGDKHPFYATNLNTLGLLRLTMGNNDMAEPLIQDALTIRKQELGENHPDYIHSLAVIARYHHLVDEDKEAAELFLKTEKSILNYLENMFNVLGEKERDQFFTTVSNFFNTFKNFTIEEAPTFPELVGEMYNLQLATKSILLNTSNKVKKRILESNDRTLIDLYDEVQSLKQMIGRNDNLPFSQVKIDLDSLNEMLSEKDKELSEFASYYAEEKKHYTWREVQATLQKGEAAIEIIRINKINWQKGNSTDSVVYAALIITSKTKNYPELLELKNGNELEAKELKYYKNTIKFKSENKNSYNAYWSPLKKYLKGINTIYFSPDGVYNSINLKTLFNPENKKYLMQESNVIMVTSTKELLGPKLPIMPLNYAIMVGNPNFGNATSTLDTRRGVSYTLDSISRSGISPLPGTKVEIDELSNLFKQKGWRQDIWTQLEATEEKLKNMRKPKVLHIATHGFFEPNSDKNNYRNNPLHRSGLLLSGAENAFQEDDVYIESGQEDGILTAFEAMNLNIENTELVVLSACETGLGEVRNGEGVYGLQRALKVAGARTILISLWKVNDQTTQELMVSFYENWLGGMSKREAFGTAQTKLKAKYPEPYYWGAFVMVGE